MNQPERFRAWILAAGLLSLATLAPTPSLAAGLETAATGSILVQPNGPRPGEAGKTYANVQGDKAGSDPKFAGFAILDFPAPARAGAERVQSATLTLTQSVARFTRDGKIKFYLASESTVGLEPLAKPLRFDPAKPGGLGDQIPGLIPVGVGEFAKGGTGDADPYPLTLDDAARKALDGQIRPGATIRLVVVPDDAHVAATFFGAGAREAVNRPKLTIATGANATP